MFVLHRLQSLFVALLLAATAAVAAVAAAISAAEGFVLTRWMTMTTCSLRFNALLYYKELTLNIFSFSSFLR